MQLQIEGTTSALFRCPLFHRWCSLDEEDSIFGSMGSPTTQDLSGYNTFLIHDNWTQKEKKRDLFDQTKLWVNTKKPTRIVMVTQTDKVIPHLQSHDPRIYEIARIPIGFPFNNNAPHQETSLLTQKTESISIILIVNKESMLLDPLDWPSLKKDLIHWASTARIDLSIPDWTDKLFLERGFATHKARVFPCTIPSQEGCIYRLFDPSTTPRNEETHLIACGIPAQFARLIDRSNRHERGLSLLGVLPKNFRAILYTSIEKPEEACKDISKTLFWSGYRIWKQRKFLNARFWKEIAPDEWKIKGKEKKSTRKRKHNKGFNSENCHNALHFFPKMFDFTKQRPNRCKCSEYHRPPKRTTTRDIRSFTKKFPTILKSNSKIPYTFRFLTQTDRTREHQDRLKRRKTTLSLSS